MVGLSNIEGKESEGGSVGAAQTEPRKGRRRERRIDADEMMLIGRFSIEWLQLVMIERWQCNVLASGEGGI
jgi:hypothetical protein